jgi:hypothetical protein
VVSALVFAPDIALLASGFNDTAAAWVSEGEFGLDQGVIILMLENFRSGLLWRLTRSIPCLRAGLKRAGFNGGWL